MTWTGTACKCGLSAVADYRRATVRVKSFAKTWANTACETW